MENLWCMSLTFACMVPAAAGCALSPEEELGRRIFEDSRLSLEKNQSCASCHAAEVGWTGPDSAINAHGSVYEGSVAGRFGNRKPPSSAYATLAGRFNYDAAEELFSGGNFWDGRATGWKLGSPAADQAQGPFLNPVEQALPNAATVLARVCAADYGRLFRAVWGASACDDVEYGYASIARSVADYEDSRTVNPFSSKYDAVLAGKAQLSKLEKRGLELFVGQGKCSACHVLEGSPGPWLTDQTYDNLGIPRNPENPFYEMDEVEVAGEPINPLGADWVDPGLKGFLSGLAADESWRTLPHVPAEMLALSSDDLTGLADASSGKHRVPTLRNVDLRPSPGFVKAFGHNGYFKSLEGIVHFYNTRDVLPRCDGPATEHVALAKKCWPAPEVDENVNRSELGDLGLSCKDESAIVAFLRTLSDGWAK